MARVCLTPSEVALALPPERSGLIAIDGFQASGKTTLARSLAESLGIPVVSVDNFLHRNQGSFFEHLKLLELSAALSKQGHCILEGLCALQVLQAISVQPLELIYVKRMAVWGWADEEGLDHFLARPAASQAPVSDSHEPPDPLQVALRSLWEEVAQYHKAYKPHKVANLVYERSAA